MGAGTPSWGHPDCGRGCGVPSNPAIPCQPVPGAAPPVRPKLQLPARPTPRGRLTHAHNPSRRPRPHPHKATSCSFPRLPVTSLPVPPRISSAAHHARSFSAALSKMADTQVGPARRWAAVSAIRPASHGGWGGRLWGRRGAPGWASSVRMGHRALGWRGEATGWRPRWGLGGPEAVCDAVFPRLRPNGRTRSSPRSSRTRSGPCWARAARRSCPATIRTSASASRHPRRYGRLCAEPRSAEFHGLVVK